MNAYGPGGFLIQYIIVVFSILVGILNMIFYGITWYKMRSVELKVKAGHQTNGGTTSGSPKYHSTARIMMAFVLAYLIQYSVSYIMTIWQLFEIPPSCLVAISAWVAFLGGMINGVVYVVVRRKLLARRIQNSSTVPAPGSGSQRY